MIPFDRCLPYETVRGDIYVAECPFCRSPNVLLPLKKDDLSPIQSGRKRRLVFPCCFATVTLLDADRDYLLTDRTLRQKSGAK